MAKVWRYGRWVIAALGIAFVALVIYRIPAVLEQKKTAQVVAQIHAQRLTMADVDGNHLPPPPDPKAVDATVEGIDANANGIRDDVELAIFAKYPNDIKIRAAELQYAKELANELSNVFNPETLAAVMQEEGRGFECLYKSSGSDDVFLKHKQEVRSLVFNTDVREKKSEDIFARFMTSHSALSGEACDLMQ